MKRITTEIDGDYIHIECPNCKSTEQQPSDQQRSHLQCFELIEWVGIGEDKNDTDLSIHKCNSCKQSFIIEWDYNKDESNSNQY